MFWCELRDIGLKDVCYLSNMVKLDGTKRKIHLKYSEIQQGLFLDFYGKEDVPLIFGVNCPFKLSACIFNRSSKRVFSVCRTTS